MDLRSLTVRGFRASVDAGLKCTSSSRFHVLRGANLAGKTTISKASVVVCPTCGRGSFVRRTGPYGSFLGCSSFPACRHTGKLSQAPFEAPS